jgi:hypothetical protein
MSELVSTNMIAAVNQLTWPGAFTVAVGSIAAAAVAIVGIRSFFG